MNHIVKLQTEVKELREAISAINVDVSSFINYLHSPKFTGVESDGGRKDWIATPDVIYRLREIQNFIYDRTNVV